MVDELLQLLNTGCQQDSADVMKKVLTKKIEVIDHVATGTMLRDHRQASGHSLRKIAGRLGVSAAYLSDLELGKRNWSQQRALLFLKACRK